jgi:hypothetical protein
MRCFLLDSVTTQGRDCFQANRVSRSLPIANKPIDRGADPRSPFMAKGRKVNKKQVQPAVRPKVPRDSIPRVEPIAADPAASAIRTIFQNGNTLRTVITENLESRTAATKVFQDRAKAAFADFNPSVQTPAKLAASNFIGKDGDLEVASNIVRKH